jgi:alpha-ketoglutarate-dependent taurine dioxygenase
MQVEPGLSDVQRLTNLDADGVATGANPDPYSLHWHIDGSATDVPARYTLLYAVRVPSSGGETSFADMYAACAALPPVRRKALASGRAIHDNVLARRFRHGVPMARGDNSLRRRLELRMRFVRRMLSPFTPRHPVIRVHEETGRSSLYLGDHAWRIVGHWWPTGERLVDELNAFATTRADWTYTHAWHAGDLLIWDNRCLLHRGSPYDAAGEERVMLRAVVEGRA